MSQGEQRNAFLKQVEQRHGAAPPNGAAGNPLLARSQQQPINPPAQQPLQQQTPDASAGASGTSPLAAGRGRGSKKATTAASAPATPADTGWTAEERKRVHLTNCWAGYAAHAVQGAIVVVGQEAFGNPAAAADLAAQIADALVAEQLKRNFG